MRRLWPGAPGWCERGSSKERGTCVRNKETAVVRLDADRFGTEALAGLDGFSHLEIVHHFDRVPVERI